MKFRNPETGEVFVGVKSVINDFCIENQQRCLDCPISVTNNYSHLFCFEFSAKFPAEAARLMGYEVIEEEKTCKTCEHKKKNGGCDLQYAMNVPVEKIVSCSAWKERSPNMEKKDKPRLAEVLGVEVEEWFRVKGFGGEYCIQPTGAFYCKGEEARSNALLFAINHPESIIRAPRLTEAELERCRVYGAKLVSKDKNCDDGGASLWRKKPDYWDGIYDSEESDALIATVFDKDAFPSVHPGDCICVEEES